VTEPGSFPVAASGEGWVRYGAASGGTAAMGRVIVPAVEDFDCAASLALRTEWVAHEVTMVSGDYGYAELFAETWKGSYGFIVVEHDVAPWPGALHQLWACSEPWCGFFYPMHFGRMAGSLGCTKFSPELVVNNPEAAEEFVGKHWDVLDGTVSVVASQATGRQNFHLHTPGVAHVRARLYP
jgi:hypothetical protein